MWLCGLHKNDVPFTFEAITDVIVAIACLGVALLMRYERADLSEESAGYLYTYDTI